MNNSNEIQTTFTPIDPKLSENFRVLCCTFVKLKTATHFLAMEMLRMVRCRNYNIIKQKLLETNTVSRNPAVSDYMSDYVLDCACDWCQIMSILLHKTFIILLARFQHFGDTKYTQNS